MSLGFTGELCPFCLQRFELTRMIKKRFGMSLRNRTGEKALPFTLTDENGRKIRFNDFKGSWLLMVFHRHLA